MHPQQLEIKLMNNSVITIVCTLILALSACSATEPLIRTEIVEVPIRVLVPIPLELTDPCGDSLYLPDNELTYGDVVTYAVQLQGVVEICNKQLTIIRELPLE